MTFGTLVVGQESRQLLEIRDNARSRRAISRVESSDPSKFSVRLLSLDEAAKRGFADDRFGNLVGLAEVTVSASALGPLDGQVLIHADDPGRPPDSIPISAKVANLVEAIPAALILPRASGTGPLFSGGCILRSNTAESMVVQIESLPPGIHVELQKNNLEHNTQVVRIEWRGNTAGSEVIRRVRLNAKVGSRECVVEIPVTIRPVKG